MSAINLSSNLGENLIINPTFDIAQRGAGISAITSTVYTADHYRLNLSAGYNIDYDIVSDIPTDDEIQSTKSLKLTNNSPQAVAASGLVTIGQPIEGYYARKVYKKNSYYSSWVKSSVAGVYSLSVSNAVDRGWVSEFTLTANTWKKIEIPVSKIDTAIGSWNHENGEGLLVTIMLSAGTNRYVGQLETWEAISFLPAGSNNVDWGNVNGATFITTQWKYHEGIDEIPFHLLARDYTTELALCQRYFYTYMFGITGNTGPVVVGVSANGATCMGAMHLPVAMRVLPILTYSNLTDFVGEESGNTLVCVGLSVAGFNFPDRNIVMLRFVITGGINKNLYSLTVDDAAGAFLHLDSEL